jgi:hypothetical protein
MKKYPVTLSFAVLSSLLYCSEMAVSGGGGSSETINAKVIITDTVATVVDDHGTGSGLVLEAYSADYRPYEKTGLAKKSSADQNVKTISLPTTGNYNILVRNEEKNLVCFIQNVHIGKGTADSILCQLSSGRYVGGKVISQKGDTIKGTFVISVQGSPFMCITDDKKEFTLKEIPGGTFTMIVRPKEQRLFIANAKYQITINDTENEKVLNVMLP